MTAAYLLTVFNTEHSSMGVAEGCWPHALTMRIAVILFYLFSLHVRKPVAMQMRVTS